MPGRLYALAIVRGMRVFAGLLVAAACLVATGSARADEVLDLDVSPQTDISVDEQTCITAEVTNDRGRPVRRAQVRMLGKRKKTDGSGEAVVCGRFRYPGRQSVHVFKGSNHDLATIVARGGDVDPGEGWKPIEIQMPAYPSAPGGGGCSFSDLFPDGEGLCAGIPNSGTNSFLFQPPTFIETVWQAPSLHFVDQTWLRFSTKGPSAAEMTGWVRWDYERGGSSRLWVTSIEDSDPRFKWSAGTDPRDAGDTGGPLLLSVLPHPLRGEDKDGYTFHARGFAWRYLPYDGPG